MPDGKIYTRSGDKGRTGLFDGSRVDKDDIRIECLGTIDEVNSTIGLLRSKLAMDHPWQLQLQTIQVELMDSMAHVATPSTAENKYGTLPIQADKRLEAWMDEIEEKLTSPTDSFLLPGGNETSALCHMVRTQMRRAERRLITLNKQDPVDPSILKFINRLSDLFFKLSREAMEDASVTEERWKLFQYKAQS